MMNDHEVELSSFQMEYRPVGLRTPQHDAVWNNTDQNGFDRRRRQKTLWVQGCAAVAVIILLLALFSPSSSNKASDASNDRDADTPTDDNRLHTEAFKLVPEDESAQAHFGITITMLDRTMFIASPAASMDGTKLVGRVYSYDGTTLSYEMESPETTHGAFFGQAMDQNGAVLVIGAPGLSKVFCYSLQNERMTLQTTVSPTNSSTTQPDNFGVAVALDGDTLIVGASLADGKTMETAYGRIYVYDRTSDGTFEELQSFESPNPQTGEMFGGTLALHGDILVVGDFMKTTSSGENSGVVYIYKRGTDKTFELLQTLQAADGGASHEGFGASVALSDTILVVGLNDREGRVIKSLNGGAFVYRKYNDEWKFESLLLAHDQAIVNGQFGGGVAVQDETIVVGSQEMDEDHAGKVYIFEKNPVTAKWMDVAELAPSDASKGHHFGRVVAIQDTTIVVGAFVDDALKTDGGSAYIFDLTK